MNLNVIRDSVRERGGHPMSRTEQLDLPRSLFHRLLNKVKENGTDFNLLLSRYGINRFEGGLRYKS